VSGFAGLDAVAVPEEEWQLCADEPASDADERRADDESNTLEVAAHVQEWALGFYCRSVSNFRSDGRMQQEG
jgi:hypothetical protein